MSTTTAHPARHGRVARFGHFVLHFFEMCMPMCIGFAVGDLVYFWVADLFGYTEPFEELPELSLAVVTFNMTAPMVAWMRFRGMPWRPILEMSVVPIALAILFIGVVWAGIAPSGTLQIEFGSFCGISCVGMFGVMLFRLDLYTGRTGHHVAHAAHAAQAA